MYKPSNIIKKSYFLWTNSEIVPGRKNTEERCIITTASSGTVMWNNAPAVATS